MSKIALITGATSGIGKAVAIAIAKEGFNIIITGRRKELLDRVANKIKEDFKVDVLSLCFDLRDSSLVEKHLGELPHKWKNIDVLVNNAGLAVGMDPIDKGTLDDWERMIDTNIKGLLYVSRIVSKGMVERESGHIVNIGSIAGKGVYPNGNVYCATKHAVDALSRAMSQDLYKYNIKVSQVCPGLAETEFSKVRFKGDNELASSVYKGYTPLKPEDIANAVIYIVMAPPHVNIADLVIMPSAQASSTLVKKDI